MFYRVVSTASGELPDHGYPAACPWGWLIVISVMHAREAQLLYLFPCCVRGFGCMIRCSAPFPRWYHDRALAERLVFLIVYLLHAPVFLIMA